MSSKDLNKRKREIVDLTNDSDDNASTHPAKQARSSITRTSSQNAYPTPSLNSTQNRYMSVYNAPSSSSYGPQSDLSNGQHSQAERALWLADPDGDDDIDEIIGLSQDAYEVAGSQGELHHYGDVPTRIVGVQYYRGFASNREVVLIRREPSNPYDSNAIRVDNVGAQQIGHIPKAMAAKLSKYIDGRLLHLTAQLAGSVGHFDCPLTVQMFGPDPQSQEGQRLVAQMKGDKLPLKAVAEAERAKKQREKELQQAEKKRQQEEKRRKAEALRAASGGKGGRAAQTPSSSQWANQSTPGESSQPVMQDILEASQRFNPRESQNITEEYGMKEGTLQNMPKASQPNVIKTKMLPYQLQALQWLLDQESPQQPGSENDESVQLWKKNPSRAGLHINLATSYSVQGPAPLASGGILADDMGLGKTLEMISLLVADNAKAGKKTGTTLIIAPLSVLSNWTGQIAHHIKESHALTVYTYHAAGRVSMKADDFAKYDVVLTTYATLASDWAPRGKSSKQVGTGLRSSGIYSMEWRRIILDEGHTIRNPASKGAAAVTAVKAKSRWVLTGTPIVNSLKDLYCLLRFVGITGGLEQIEVFNGVLIRPLKSGSPEATFLLQAIMSAFTLRRKKEMKFINLNLPELEEYKHQVEFTKKERERYDAFQKQAQGMLVKYQKTSAKGGKTQAYNNLLEILLRMRQVCNHQQLCSERVQSVMAQLEQEGTVALNDETKRGLQDLLQIQIEQSEDCAICLESLHGHSPVITTCGHSFGTDCIKKVIEIQHKCPFCRRDLVDETCLIEPANDCGDESKDDEMDLTASSSKLEAMMSILSATKVKSEKTIIFSQWTRFLDIVEARLARDGYKYCRIDGTMPAHKRDAALQALEHDDGTTVMLASLGVCAVGLNLTAANQIILSDTWWAPAIEDQAVDRVHRLGQTRACRVFRLVVEKTIEDSVLEIQSEKRKLMRLAFGEKSGKRDAVKQGRMADIQRMLNPAAAAAAASEQGGQTADGQTG